MSTPAWISSLPVGVVRTDLLQDAAGGVLTYADALQVLADVATSGSVTASEFAALQTVAANLNNGLTVSTEVASLFTQLVDGSPANATWTGGAAGTTTPLGNLEAGTTSGQLDELIGQWFLGTNLPDPTQPGATGSPYPYTAISAPLYGASGAASVNDICQGSDGDCELMAGLVSMAENHPQQLGSMIVANPNGTWGVRFYVGGNEVWETVNDELPTYSGTNLLYSSNPNNQNTALWVGLVEKAYVQLSATGLIGHPAVDGYANINADPPTDVLPNLSDATQVNYFFSSSSNFYSEKAWYIDAVDSGDDVILESWGNTDDSSGKMELVNDHAFAVIGYDSTTGDFIVRNPWGAESSGQSWDAQFEVSLTSVAGVNGDFVIDNSGIDNSVIRLDSESGQVLANTPTSISGFFATSDTTGAAATRYNLQLLGGASIQLNGAVNLATAAQTSLGQIVVSASDLSKITITAAAGASQQDLLVSAYDGKAWSATTDIPLTVSPTSATMNPVLGCLVAAGGVIQVSSLFTITAPGAAWYAFYVPDGAGVINLDGATNYGSGTTYEVAASQLSLLTYTAPTSGGSVTLQGEVYVGTAWTNWQNVQVNVGVSVSTALLGYANGQLAAVANVADNAANIFANLDALQSAFEAGELTSIGATDTTLQHESLSQAQYTADLGVLSILQGDVELTIVGLPNPATIAQYTAQSSLYRSVPGGFAIVDTAANIAAGISTLEAVASRITSITASDAGLTLFLSQALGLEKTHLKISVPTGDAFVVDGVAANIETLTAAQISGLVAAGVSSLVSTNASISFTAAQTAAIVASGLKVSASGNFTVTQNTSTGYSVYRGGVLIQQEYMKPDGGYEIANLAVTGQSYTFEENIYSAAKAHVAKTLNNVDGSGSLALYGPNLTVTVSGTADSLKTGADNFNVAHHGVEAINAGWFQNETFSLSSGFGNVTVSDFALKGTGHDTIELSVSMFSYLTASMTSAQDLAAVLSHAASSGGNLIITDTVATPDSLTLTGVTSAMLSANPADVVFAGASADIAPASVSLAGASRAVAPIPSAPSAPERFIAAMAWFDSPEGADSGAHELWRQPRIAPALFASLAAAH